MRVLVTGGAGYVGTSVIEHLVRHGHEAVCLDPRGGEVPGLIPRLDEAPGRLEVVAGSVLDARMVRALGRSCDGVIHLAALVGAPACEKDPDAAWTINVEGTRTLLDALPEGMPLVVASTCSVYGQVPLGICTERAPTQPLTVYGETKVESERLVMDWGGTALRFVTLYGDSPRFRWDLLLHTFLQLANTSGRLELFDPDAYRPLLHVRDAARSLVFALERFPQLAGAIFNVGSSALTLTKRELAECVAKLTPFDIRIESTRFDPDRRDYKVSFDLIEAQGYQAEVDFESELPRLLAYVKSNLQREATL
jgi:nucleoside-diphosphate-sugar epimerase